IRVTKGENYRNSTFKPEEVGDIIAIGTAHAPGGSIPHAVYTNQCVDLKLEDVTLYASNCFGFLEVNCDNTTYLRCKIDRRQPETELKERDNARIRSLNADAFHSKHAIKGPAIIGCTARFQGDDCINICGDYHMITASEGKELRVLAKHNMNIEVGDPVELLTYQGERLPDAEIVKITPDGEINDAERDFLSHQKMNDNLKTNNRGALTRAFKITLDRAVELSMGSIICSMRRTGNGFTVKNCDFGYNRSRGILIKASDGEVSGNTLTENWGEAIKVAPEYWWLESGSSNNVEIRDNIIRDCRSLPIAVYAFGGPRDIVPVGAHNNITITGNTISDCLLPNILVTSTKGLKIENNVHKPSKAPDPRPWRLGQFKLNPEDLEPVMTINCDDCDIGNNQIR
ncbi:right-handed parallel beta-helix repeat-containing protein, partial [Candidatus Poribacteria bacterium]